MQTPIDFHPQADGGITMNASDAPDITFLLNAGQTHDGGLASEEALPLIYDELRRIAARQMAGESREHTLQPTALVHEAWLRLNHRRTRVWNDRLHFFRVAVRTMRRILVDRSRQRSCLKYADAQNRINIDDIALATASPDDRVLLVDSALEELQRTDPAIARIVDLKFFGGFTNKEVAWMSGISERTVERQWLYAKARIFQILQHSST